mgnify:CR=1 FL=1|jgi:ssDNA-binding Zn-finger/Zn-ribbon topoisomerase 1
MTATGIGEKMYGKCSKCNLSNNLFPIKNNIIKFFGLDDHVLCHDCINNLLSDAVRQLKNTWGNLGGGRTYVSHDLVVGIDLDGVLAKYEKFAPGHYGEIIPGAKDLIQKFRDNGWKITIWTCREADEAKVWLLENDIYFDSINEHPTWKSEECPKPKLPANIFIDDSALFHPRNEEWTSEKIEFIYEKAVKIAGK